jgi:hypothetical protein
MPWVRSIGNHLYWSAQSCNGNGDMLKMLKEKWMSCIHHIANVHFWDGNLMAQCEHGEVADDVAWLDIDSPAPLALKKVVLDKKLLKDIVKLSDFCHTGALEVYHSMLLKYAPKRLHFNYAGMRARLQLAAIDHNYNVDRKLEKDKNGVPRVKQAYTKAKKNWILRNVYESKQFGYIENIIQKIVERRYDTNVQMNDPTYHVDLPPLRATIATTEKPTIEEAKLRKFSRMIK